MEQNDSKNTKSASKKYLLLITAAIAVIAVIIALAAKPEPCGDCVVDGDDLQDQIVRPGFPNADAIPVQHTFSEGMHRITGNMTLPDPCYDIEHEVVVMESFPEQVRIELTTPRRDELCATVLTDKSFTVEFQASEQAVISAMLNGEPVELAES